jgi:hypothetical protein
MHTREAVQTIEGSLNQKEFALGVFLDIDGAFDASFGSMDVASGEHGVVLTLAVETFKLKSRGSCGRMLVNRGCPQGGALCSLVL